MVKCVIGGEGTYIILDIIIVYYDSGLSSTFLSWFSSRYYAFDEYTIFLTSCTVYNVHISKADFVAQRHVDEIIMYSYSKVSL